MRNMAVPVNGPGEALESVLASGTWPLAVSLSTSPGRTWESWFQEFLLVNACMGRDLLQCRLADGIAKLARLDGMVFALTSPESTLSPRPDCFNW